MSGHLNNSFMNEFEPSEFYLSQNYPNPFKDKTTIKYCVAYRTRVNLTIYDSEGNKIEKLVDEEQIPGTYEVKFNASKDHFGKTRSLADGYYFYRMVAGDYCSEKKWLCRNHLIGRFSMKLLMLALFFFLPVSQICFAQWVQVGLNDKSIKDIAVQNSNIFAVTMGGTVKSLSSIFLD